MGSVGTSDVFFAVCNNISFSEKQRDTPYTGKTYKCIYNAAYDIVLSAEKPGNQVKLEKTDAAPV